jgi:twitching motility two-component system response regulator PilH
MLTLKSYAAGRMAERSALMVRGKILVVDDSPTDLALMIAPLRREGYDVVIATDGEEALRKVQDEQPNCVVLDVVMPRKNGFQVCRTIKGDTASRHIPVILLTSKSERTDELWGMRQGADIYLTTPFNGDDLLARVRQVL